MTIQTNKGNFGSFKDLLLDMKYQKYDSVIINDITAICNIIHLGSISGVQSKADIEKICNELEKDVI